MWNVKINRIIGQVLVLTWIAFAVLACDNPVQESTVQPELEVPKTMVKIYNSQSGQTQEVARIEKSPQQWREELTAEQYRIAREQGTERAFTQEYTENKEPGVYQCVGCGTDLYLSETKFDSGSGWPSFYAAVAEGNVATEVDQSAGMVRTEVKCGRCGAHLGHIFNDGPQPTGMRHCINSAVLEFVLNKD